MSDSEIKPELTEEEREQLRIYEDIMLGLADVEAGRTIPGEQVIEWLRRKYGGKCEN